MERASQVSRILSLTVTLGLVSVILLAGEEKKTNKDATGTVPANVLVKAVQVYINQNKKENDGDFVIEDRAMEEKLQAENKYAVTVRWILKLVKFREDNFRPLGEGTYSAWGDFKTRDGRIVTLDFILKTKDQKLAVGDVLVQSVDGESRFTYKQNGSSWERVAKN